MSGCGLQLSFGRKKGSMKSKAMRLARSENISLKEAWDIIKGIKVSRRRGRRVSRRRVSRRRVSGRRGRRVSRRRVSRRRVSGRRGRRVSRRRVSRRRASGRKRRSRRFGIVPGPGYEGATSYPNAYAPYFGSEESFVNASQWWYPYTGGVAQSPQMLMRGPGN